MLQELPQRVLDPCRSRSAFVDRNPLDGFVESHVGFFPAKHADKLFAKRIHDCASYQRCRAIRLRTSYTDSMKLFKGVGLACLVSAMTAAAQSPSPRGPVASFYDLKTSYLDGTRADL